MLVWNTFAGVLDSLDARLQYFCWSSGFLGCSFVILLLECWIPWGLVCNFFAGVLDILGARL